MLTRYGELDRIRTWYACYAFYALPILPILMPFCYIFFIIIFFPLCRSAPSALLQGGLRWDPT